MRIRIISWLVAFIFLFLGLNLFHFEVIRGKYYRELSERNSIRLIPQEGSRGRILDRNDKVIVDNELCYDVMVMPGESSHLDVTLMNISQILGIKSEDLAGILKSSFYSSSVAITVAQNISVKKAILLEELRAGLDGIVIQPRPQRRYPYGRLACHILGYLNEIDHWRLSKMKDFGYRTKDIVGFGGVEERYDYVLRQQSGGMSLEVDHRGRFVRTLGFRYPKSGRDIKLTLDIEIQKIVEGVLKDKKGAVVIMQPHSGEILALASTPGFDPAVFVKRDDHFLSYLLNRADAPLLNRAIAGLYPAGSVFKLIVATAAQETGKINPTTTFTCNKTTHIGRQEFSCWSAHREQNLFAAITHSCNIFFYKSGLLIGAQAIHDWAFKFGFGKTTSVDLPYEEAGLLPSPLWKKVYKFQNWFDGDTANLSIGQGELLVTPLQVCRMLAVFANGGTLVKPYIVKEIDGRDISVYQRKATKPTLQENTLVQIKRGLKNVVSEPTGTANVLSGLSVSVAGKTGTAQVGIGQPHAWFAGFFPFQDPKFVLCVLLDHGGSGYYATLVAKEIIEKMLQEKLL